MWLQQLIFLAVLAVCFVIFRFTPVRSLIDHIFQNPAILRRVAGWLVVASVIEWVEAKLFGWVHMVEYVSHLSQLAITLSTIPWWQGLRVEERQVEEDIPGAVVEKLVKETDVSPDSGGPA